METQYEVKNLLPRKRFVNGVTFWAGMHIRVTQFSRADAFRVVSHMRITRLKPARTEIRRMAVAELRQLCESEGLSASGPRQELVANLLETEVRE